MLNQKDPLQIAMAKNVLREILPVEWYHDELLVKLQSESLKSNPGESSVYCNNGFQLLEILIERVSSLSYSEFLETYISKPLHLTSTITPRDSFDRDRLTKTYFPGMDQALPVENANLIGTGGIYSTAEEVSKFTEVLIGNRTDILSEKSAKTMQSHEYRKGVWVSEETNTINYGLGWDAVRLAPFSDYGITALFKGGDTYMYHAALTTLPEHDISIAVLSSGGSSTYNSIFASNILLEYTRTKGIIKEILPKKTFEPPLKVDMPSDLLAYSGLYGTVGKTVWEHRNGKNYYALDEKITSIMYLTKALLAKNISVDINHGYASGTKIVDNSTFAEPKLA